MIELFSVEVLDAFIQSLDELGIIHEDNRESGIVFFTLSKKNIKSDIECFVNVVDEEILFYCDAPVKPDFNNEKIMNEMYKFISCANYEIDSGCFAFEYDLGKLRYRNFIDFDGIKPSIKIIKKYIARIEESFADCIDEIEKISMGCIKADEAIEMLYDYLEEKPFIE